MKKAQRHRRDCANMNMNNIPLQKYRVSQAGSINLTVAQIIDKQKPLSTFAAYSHEQNVYAGEWKHWRKLSDVCHMKKMKSEASAQDRLV